jgi:hypothetical protein
MPATASGFLELTLLWQILGVGLWRGRPREAGASDWKEELGRFLKPFLDPGLDMTADQQGSCFRISPRPIP